MYNCSHISSKSKNIILTSGRTGSSLIIQSLINNGYNVASEPLNFNFQDYQKYIPNDINNITNIDKIEIIHKILKDYNLCKILYYQIHETSMLKLAEKYNIILLTRDFFDVFISFEIAQIIKRWHNNGQSTIIPRKKNTIDKNKFINTITYFKNQTNLFRNIASKEITYNEVINDWDNVINYFLEIINMPKTKVQKYFLKNPENPEDFIENYQELRDIYNKLTPTLSF